MTENSDMKVRTTSGLRIACEKAAKVIAPAPKGEAALEEDKIVSLTRKEWSEVSNLLQIMTVFGVQLHMQGDCHPNREILKGVFDKLAMAGLRRACGNPPEFVPAQALADLLKAAESILPSHEASMGIKSE